MFLGGFVQSVQQAKDTHRLSPHAAYKLTDAAEKALDFNADTGLKEWFSRVLLPHI